MLLVEKLSTIVETLRETLCKNIQKRIWESGWIIGEVWGEWGVLMGSPDEGVVERPELYLQVGEDGMKKMMNMEKLLDEVIISRLNENHL